MLKNLKNMLNTNKYMEIDVWENMARENEVYYTYYSEQKSNIVSYANESEIFDDEDEDEE